MTVVENRDALDCSDAHETVLDCLAAGVEAARPERVVAGAVDVGPGDPDSDASAHGDGQARIGDGVYDLDGYDEVVVLGGGNAAAGVAAALERMLEDAIDGGVVVTDDPAPTEHVDIVEGAHPVPDKAGERGARRVRERALDAGGETLVLAVVTGGGSALLPAPAGELDLGNLRATTQALVESGAAIDEINAVRKHLSALKGGRLATAAAPATVASLVFSDVVGDDLDVVASGPTAPDPTTFADALAVLDRYDLDVPASVRDHLDAGTRGERAETPDPRTETPGPDADFSHVRHHVLADAWTAIEAARETAAEAGYETMILSSRVRGEAREQGLAHAAVAEEVAATGSPVESPAIVISGGETTVTVRGDGSGGPNQEFALRAAIELPDGAVLGALDTDGLDGGTDAVGALVDAETVPDAETAARARAHLTENDAAPFLAERGALVHTGPTGTNVNDLRVLLVA